jgi:hypothetical protein
MTHAKRSEAITVETLLAIAKRVVNGQVKRGLTSGCKCIFDGKVVRIQSTPPLSDPLEFDTNSDLGSGFDIRHRVVSGASQNPPIMMGWRIFAWAGTDLRDLDGIVLDGMVVAVREIVHRRSNRRGRYVKIAEYRPRNTVPDSWVARRLSAYAPCKHSTD